MSSLRLKSLTLFLSFLLVFLLAPHHALSDSTAASLPEACRMLPPEGGDCKALHTIAYYDQDRNACDESFYGGCGGAVPFHDIDDCRAACEVDEALRMTDFRRVSDSHARVKVSFPKNWGEPQIEVLVNDTEVDPQLLGEGDTSRAGIREFLVPLGNEAPRKLGVTTTVQGAAYKAFTPVFWSATAISPSDGTSQKADEKALPLDPPDGEGEITAEEYAVYQGFFEIKETPFHMRLSPDPNGFPSEGRLVYEKTSSGKTISQEFLQQLAQSGDLDPTMIESYNSRNIKASLIKDRIFVEGLSVITEEKLAGMIKRGGFGEGFQEELLSSHPFADTIVHLSRVGFNSEKNLAVFYAGSSTGVMGSGYSVAMEKIDGAWRLKDAALEDFWYH